MKGSVLIQDEELMCRPLEDYKTMLLLMSERPDFTYADVGGESETQQRGLTGEKRLQRLKRVVSGLNDFEKALNVNQKQ